MEKTFIPKEKIQEGFEVGKQHISFLIKNSEQLFDKRKYSIALPLAILAYEEVPKLREIMKHISQDRGFSSQEWFSLTRGSKGKSAHQKKLTKLLEDSQSELKEKGMADYYRSARFLIGIGALPPTKSYSRAIKENKLVKKTLEKLDQVKQDCFYLNWKNGDWFAFNKIQTEKQKALCYIVIYLVKIFFRDVLIQMKFPKIPLDKKHPIHIAYVKDHHVKESLRLEKLLLKPEFKIKRDLAISVLDELYLHANRK